MIQLPKVITDFLDSLNPEQAARVLTGRLNDVTTFPSEAGDGCLTGLALGPGNHADLNLMFAFDNLCYLVHRQHGTLIPSFPQPAPPEVQEAIRSYLLGKVIIEPAPQERLLIAAGSSTVAE